MKTPLSIQETYATMVELMEGGQEPSILLAYWSAALSSRMKLYLNSKYVRVVAQYIHTGLPDRETLLDALGRKPGQKLPQGMMWSHIDVLYRLEDLHRAGVLNFDSGSTLESQQAWRDRMVALIPGMGCKLVSWAHFIFNPLYTKLLTVDSWHCKRLGVDQATISGTSLCKRTNYLAVEKRMLAECQGLYPEYPPVIVSAMLWENARIAANASQGDAHQSYRGLSCRNY